MIECKSQNSLTSYAWELVWCHIENIINKTILSPDVDEKQNQGNADIGTKCHSFSAAIYPIMVYYIWSMSAIGLVGKLAKIAYANFLRL